MIICQLAGFLGSGKTTLLVRLGTELSQAGKKVAIIVNEVGEIGVDGAVIDSFGLKTVEITEGCICCSLSGSLQNTLREISSKFDPDVIIIEPTGIALASKINDFVRRAMVGEEHMYTICLIDAYRAIELFNEAELFLSRQIIGANIVAVNKIDIVDEATKTQVTDIVNRVAPGSKIAYVSAKTGQGLEPLVALLEGRA
ncbi:GTP-binding protein [Methanomassiliicoccus luminyensis]|uniref:GTP-binding protein n=1 Tax=Methanomassiliicoccus luminyensis TaxID=1080712 RepID=UPI000474771D|nr:molybdopterin-guanine dinucleotide biosynthesis protein MobB [Methanomassiliicoccus luminyensis]